LNFNKEMLYSFFACISALFSIACLPAAVFLYVVSKPYEPDNSIPPLSLPEAPWLNDTSTELVTYSDNSNNGLTDDNILFLLRTSALLLLFVVLPIFCLCSVFFSTRIPSDDNHVTSVNREGDERATFLGIHSLYGKKRAELRPGAGDAQLLDSLSEEEEQNPLFEL